MYNPAEIHDDDRAVSELLGAIFVFALVLSLVVLLQVNLVPAMNQQVEYEQNLRAQDDMRSLQSSLYRVTATGAPETVPVELGVTYPQRPLLLNPPPVTGTLRTTGPITDGVVIRNLGVPNDPETDEYWASGRPDVGTYESRLVRYDVDYNEYRGQGRTILEGGVLFNAFDSADVVASHGGLIDGRRINLVVLGGNYSESATGLESVPVNAVSGPTRTVSVRDAGDPITISVRTLLSAEEWTRRLEGEPYVVAPVGYDDPDGDPTTPNVLTVTLRPGVTYELRMAKAGIGTGVGRTEAAYLTRAPTEIPSVPATGGEISVDVRDAFNNPVSGVNVRFTIESSVNGSATLSKGDDSGGTLVVRSTESGQATVTLSGTAERATIDASIEADGTAGTADYERVEFDALIGGGGGGGDGEDINPNRDGVLVLESGNYYDCEAGKNCEGAAVTFLAKNTEKEITDVRLNFYQSNSPGSSPSDLPTSARIVSEDGSSLAAPIVMSLGGEDVDATALAEYAENGRHTYLIEFWTFNRSGTPDAAPFEPQGGDQFAITIQFADGTRATYFVNGLALSGPP